MITPCQRRPSNLDAGDDGLGDGSLLSVPCVAFDIWCYPSWLAQWVEQQTINLSAEGSNPSLRTGTHNPGNTREACDGWTFDVPVRCEFQKRLRICHFGATRVSYQVPATDSILRKLCSIRIPHLIAINGMVMVSTIIMDSVIVVSGDRMYLSMILIDIRYLSDAPFSKCGIRMFHPAMADFKNEIIAERGCSQDGKSTLKTLRQCGSNIRDYGNLPYGCRCTYSDLRCQVGNKQGKRVSKGDFTVV